MSTKSNWFSQFVTEAQQQTLRERVQGLSLEEHKQIGLAWQALFAEIRANMHRSPDDPLIQSFVDRWDALLGDFTQQDADLKSSLNDAYSEIASMVENPVPSLAALIGDWQAIVTFIQQARPA